MKNKDYLAAEAFIVSDRMDKTVGSDEYYAYLAECVNGMCADGKNQAAIAFINRKVSSFDGWETNPEKRHYEKYSSDAAKKRLLEIVRSY